MASNQVLSSIMALPNDIQPGNAENIVYLTPSKFKMKLLKRLVSMESKQELKTASVLKRTQSENGFQASIVLPNGELGTLFSLDKTKRQVSRQSSQNGELQSVEQTGKSILPLVQSSNLLENDTDTFGLRSPEPEYKRPLKLPPIILPSVYSTKTYPIGRSDQRPPPSPLTDEKWEELKDCRYLRPAPKKFRRRTVL